MKIGIDLDGVVYDTEKNFRIYSELYDLLELKQNGKINGREIRFQDRFNWNEEQAEAFMEKYCDSILRESNYMPGAKHILKMLKEDGHELIVITARGTFSKNKMINLTEERLKEDKMDIFDKYYFGVEDKAVVCKKENIDIMIDDSNINCKNTSDNEIKTIYLKDAPSYDMDENDYLKVLYNWGEIYRYLKEMEV
jgi:uncharacterized HAD superfamily protein